MNIQTSESYIICICSSVQGYETTAGSLSHLILLLAMHPDYQERVYEECMSVHLTEDEHITGESLARLEFLDRCIKESLRLIPAVPFLTRQLTGDVELVGHTIPPGVEFVLNIISMHHSEKYYKNPKAFDPDHFLPDEVAKRHPYSYLPFSGGPRLCIGR